MLSYSRYSHHARRALAHARLLVSRYHHPYIDTGHLLVGVMLSEGSIGHIVLKSLNLDADNTWLKLESITETVEQPPDPPSNAASLDSALELAKDESVSLGHHYLGTEHLLLGMTRTNVGNAGTLLRLLNIAPEQVRHRVRRSLDDGLTEFSLQHARNNLRLSELSRRVISAAEQLSISLDHQTVGLGHLLLVLMREKRSITSAILCDNMINEKQLEQTLDEQESNALISIEEVLTKSVGQAHNLGSHYTGTEHILLSLLVNKDGVKLLQNLNVSPEKLRDTIEKRTQKK